MDWHADGKLKLTRGKGLKLIHKKDPLVGGSVNEFHFQLPLLDETNILKLFNT